MLRKDSVEPRIEEAGFHTKEELHTMAEHLEEVHTTTLVMPMHNCSVVASNIVSSVSMVAVDPKMAQTQSRTDPMHTDLTYWREPTPWHDHNHPAVAAVEDRPVAEQKYCRH